MRFFGSKSALRCLWPFISNFELSEDVELGIFPFPPLAGELALADMSRHGLIPSLQD
jgi:hypothetical protein